SAMPPPSSRRPQSSEESATPRVLSRAFRDLFAGVLAEVLGAAFRSSGLSPLRFAVSSSWRTVNGIPVPVVISYSRMISSPSVKGRPEVTPEPPERSSLGAGGDGDLHEGRRTTHGEREALLRED